MAQKQIGFYGRFQPHGVDDGSARVFQALSRVGDQVAQQATALGQQVRRRQADEAARIEAATAAAEGRPPREIESLNPFSVYNETYNKTVMEGFDANIRNTARTKFSEFVAAQGDNPNEESFRAEADGWIQGATDGLPPAMAEQLKFDLGQAVERQAFSIGEAQRAKALDKSTGEINVRFDGIGKDIAQAASTLDYDEMERLKTEGIDLLQRNAAILGPEKVAEGIAQLESTIAIESAMGQVEEAFFNTDDPEEGLANATKFYRDLIQKDKVEGLDPDQKRALESKIATRIKTLGDNFVVEGTKKAQAASAFELGVIRGDFTQEEVNTIGLDLVRDGSITQAKWIELQTKVLKADMDAMEKNEHAIEFDNIISGNPTPGYVVTQGNANTVYKDNWTAQYENMTPDQRLNADTAFAMTFRKIPSLMKDRIQNGLRSTDPEQIKQAITLVDRINEEKGMFDAAVAPEDRAYAERVLFNIEQAGMTSDRAIKEANIEFSPENIGLRKDRIQKFKDKVRDDKIDFQAMAVAAMGGDPTAAQKSAGTTLLRGLTEQYYAVGLGWDKAVNKATQVLENNTAEDPNFGVMPFAPSQYYDAGEGTAWVKEAFIAEVDDLMPEGVSVNPDTIDLRWNDATQKSAREGNPSYMAIWQGTDGEYYSLPGGNNWAPDFAAYKEDLRVRNLEAEQNRLFGEELAAYEADEEYMMTTAERSKKRKGSAAQQAYIERRRASSGFQTGGRAAGKAIAEVAKPVAESLESVDRAIKGALSDVGHAVIDTERALRNRTRKHFGIEEE